MRKFMNLLLTAVLITLSSFSYSQVKYGKINGTVIDGSSKTIESATITLLRAKDSSIAKMGIADKTGKYSFDEVQEGRYMVTITAVGHQKGFSETFDVNSSNLSVTLKTIELIPQSKSMGEVTVTAKKPLIEQKIDRTIVNVDAS